MLAIANKMWPQDYASASFAVALEESGRWDEADKRIQETKAQAQDAYAYPG